MEYETYETDATYDEMYDEGTKEKVCLICTESASFYLNQQLFLERRCWFRNSYSSVKVKSKRSSVNGESKAERENWVGLHSFLVDFCFYLLSEKEAGSYVWFTYNPAADPCPPAKCFTHN